MERLERHDNFSDISLPYLKRLLDCNGLKVKHLDELITIQQAL